MSIIYTDLVQWYCEACGDEGEAGSQHAAEQQASKHECTPVEDSGT